MAHAFKIMDNTNTITTYTDYDSIPLLTLKHVIAFEPDLGTEVTANEILLEIDTLDSGETDNFIEEYQGAVVGDNLVLNGTDGSSTNAGDNLIMEHADGRHKLVPEDFADGEENHLMLETAADLSTIGHYHPPVGTHHTDGDGHTAAEHREIALWNHKLQLLMIQERA